MIHKSSFFRALEMDTANAPPLALKYAMWATAAMVSAEHRPSAEELYNLGRKHAEELEMEVRYLSYNIRR